MSAPLPEGDLAIAFDGKTWTLRMDWAAIAFFERVSGASLVDFLVDQQRGRPKLSHMAYLLQAAMQRHHAGIDLDTCGRMAFDPDVQARLFELTGESMPQQAGPSAGNV